MSFIRPSSSSPKPSSGRPDRGPSSCTITARHSLLCTLPPTCTHSPTSIANTKDLEVHYCTYHAHVCELEGCGCVFPSARLLELHQTECHDPSAAVRKEKGEKIFACYLSSCARLFLTPDARRLHLVQVHAFSKEYFFGVTNKGVGELLRRWEDGASLIRGGWRAEGEGDGGDEKAMNDDETGNGDGVEGTAIDEDSGEGEGDVDADASNAEQNPHQYERQQPGTTRPSNSASSLSPHINPPSDTRPIANRAGEDPSPTHRTAVNPSIDTTMATDGPRLQLPTSPETCMTGVSAGDDIGSDAFPGGRTEMVEREVIWYPLPGPLPGEPKVLWPVGREGFLHRGVDVGVARGRGRGVKTRGGGVKRRAVR